MRSKLLTAAVVVGLVALGSVLAMRSLSRRQAAGRESDERSAVLPKGPPSDFFARSAIGDPIRADERPRMAHVPIADLDRDSLPDVLACDALRNRVVWIRQSAKGTFTEVTIAEVPAPAHVTAIDFDGDGDLDLLVAALGVLMPNNNRVGSVLLLENDGRQQFTTHVLASGIARVADVEAGDLDGDGDLDLAAAGLRVRRWRHQLVREQGRVDVRAARAAASLRPDQRDRHGPQPRRPPGHHRAREPRSGKRSGRS